MLSASWFFEKSWFYLNMEINQILRLDRSFIYSILLFLPFVGTSYYFSSLGLAPFSIIGYAFALFLLVKYNGYNKSIFLSIYLFIYLSVVFLPVSLYWIIFEGLTFRLNTFLGIFLGVILFISSELLAKKLNSVVFQSCLNVLLCVVLFFFYFQFFAMFLFDVHIDFIVSVTGEEQRLTGHSRSIEGIGVFTRTSGIFAEPALHAYMVIVLLICMININCLKLPAFIFSIVSVWLSFSASGILLSVIPIVMYILRSEISVKFAFFTIVVFFFASYFELFYLVFEEQFLRLVNIFDDDSGSHRLEFVSFFLENKLVFFGGFGVFVNIMDVVPPSTFIVSVIYCFGFPLTLFFLVVIFAKALENYGFFGAIIFIIICILVAYPISSPFFWFAMSLFHTSFILKSRI